MAALLPLKAVNPLIYANSVAAALDLDEVAGAGAGITSEAERWLFRSALS